MPCASTSEMSRFMLRSLVQLHVEPSMKQPTESALFFAMMMLFEAATMNWLSAVLLTSASELSPNTKVPSPKALARRPTARLYWPLATLKRPPGTVAAKPFAVLSTPPPTVLELPLAVLLAPPATVLVGAVAVVLFLPPPIVVASPLDVFRKPPAIRLDSPLATFANPPPTKAPSAVAAAGTKIGRAHV